MTFTYRVVESGAHQVFLPYSLETHPPQTKYNCHMPAPEILEWLEARGISYWASGWPEYGRLPFRREFKGTGINFKDKDIAMLFKLTWVGL